MIIRAHWTCLKLFILTLNTEIFTFLIRKVNKK